MIASNDKSRQRTDRLWSHFFRRPPPVAAEATLITCLRDEGPFLIEWLAYHKAIGFKRILVGANDCSDGSHEMLTRLAELGELEYYPFQIDPAQKSAQWTFEAIIATRQLVRLGDWICWLDLDEFLNIHLGEGQLSDLCQALETADGIRINWRMFGADNTHSWPGRQLHPDLCRCAPVDLVDRSTRVNQLVMKSFYRFLPFQQVKVHGPAYRLGTKLLRLSWVVGDGKRIKLASPFLLFIAGRGGIQAAHTVRGPNYDWAQINHYFIRHPALIGMRQRRGRGSAYVPAEWVKDDPRDYTERHSASYYARHNRTDDEDRSILRHLPAVDREMARLLEDDTVRHWHEHAQGRLAAYLVEAAASE